MTASELRIGNYVKDPYGKIVMLVSVERDASMLRPIPLTEEWLLRFGFVGPANGWYSFKGEDCFIIGEKKEGWFIMEYPYMNPFIYIHQLQNLYFVLTGEELKQQIP